MKRFLTAIAILLSFVWTVSAQTRVYLKTDTTLQQKGDYNDVYFEQTHNDWPMGCMATAMTTVMKYHESPKNYNYTIIKGENGLAQLMYDAALSVNTQFSATESSAALSEVALQLVNRFGYDVNSVKYYLKAGSGMSDQEWIALIVRNINNGMPVIYAAGTTPQETTGREGGNELPGAAVRHAFVIDGIRLNPSAPYSYDFHINGGQGMGVKGNSQWVSDIFKGVTIGNLTYSDTPEMVCGIRTAEKAAASVSPLRLVSYEGSRGLSMSVETITLGQPFNVSIASLQNWQEDGTEFTGYIFPVLVRMSDNGKEPVITTPDNTLDIAKVFNKGDGFSYRRTLSQLTIEGAKFSQLDGNNVNLQDYTLRLATADKIDTRAGGGLNLHLVEPLDGETPDLITSIPAVNPSNVKVKFEIGANGGVALYERQITNTISYPELSGEKELPYGKPFLFFAKRTSSAGADGEVILTVNGKKYLMKDYFASKNFASLFDGAFYITPTSEMTISAQYINRNNLVTKQMDVTTAGGLEKLFSDSNINPCTIGTLTLTGDINANDIFYIRDNMPMLEQLDLSGVNIVAVGSHPANTIPEAAFYKEVYNKDGYMLALKEVTLPSSCTAIGSNAFMYCKKLEKVVIGKNVRTINYNVFFGCSNLNQVYVNNPVPCFINWCVFKNISNNSTLYVPAGTKEAYVGEDNKNKIPGMLWAPNEWYNRWHDGSSQGKCVEMSKETDSRLNIQLMRTNFISFRNGGMKPGQSSWNGGEYKVLPSISSPVSYTMWKLRAVVSYTESGQNKAEYVYGTSSNADYTFDLANSLNAIKGKGIKDATVKIEVYLNVTEAVEERTQKGQNYFYPYIYDGMEVTLVGGWTKSNSHEPLDLNNFYFGLRSGFSSNLPKAKAIITLDNARIGSIQTGTVDMDVILKNDNELAGRNYNNDFESFLIDEGRTVSLSGSGTLTLANSQEKAAPHAYAYNGGVLDIQHGVTLKNLEQMTFDNIKLTYTRTFDRVISNGGSTKGYGWETLALPFKVYRIQKGNGRQVEWATSNKSGDFWLREMENSSGTLNFTSDVDTIQAGHSYIISVPDAGTVSLIGQPLTFVGPTLVGGQKLVQDFYTPNYESGNLNVDMMPYPYATELPSDYYVMSRDGGSFYRWSENSNEDENLVAIRQFEAYFEPRTPAAAAMMAFSLDGDVMEDETTTGITGVGSNDDDKGLNVSGGDGAIIVTSDRQRTVTISTIDGRSQNHHVGKGTTRISMQPGVYVVKGKKVLVNK